MKYYNPLRTIIPSLNNLNEKDCELIGEYVARFILEQEHSDECPYCHTDKYKKNGHVKGSQRYMCLNCGKTFNLLDGCALQGSKVSKEIWHKFIVGMFIACYKGYKIPRIYDINKNTATRMYNKAFDTIESFCDYINDNLVQIIAEEAIIERKKLNSNT